MVSYNARIELGLLRYPYLSTWQYRHDFPDDGKKAYLEAQQCVLTSPAKGTTQPGAVSRWDEFASLHQIHALQIHTTGQFLPYHRYMLKIHRELLKECGYEGVIPCVCPHLASYASTVTYKKWK